MPKNPKTEIRTPTPKVIIPKRKINTKVLLLRNDMDLEDLVNLIKPTPAEVIDVLKPFIPKPIKGDDGLEGPKGEDGKSPTEEELYEIANNILPTKEEILNNVSELIPKEKDIIEKVVKKIPKPKNGKDGKGEKGEKGADGKSFRFADLTAYEKQVLTGPPGATGVGVPRGGTTGQKLIKTSTRDFHTEWADDSGGGGAVDSVNGQTGVVVLDADDIGETASRIWFTTAEETKLGGIETGAEVNTIDTVSDTTEIDLAITARALSASIVAGSIDESKLDTSVNASLDLADTAVQPAGLSGYELLSNKATDFTTINNTLYPTVQAVNTAINTAVTGLLDYRGSYDASANLFPATGGSGILGAILSGDFWICSVAGTLGGTPVTLGDLIIAIVDTPGQTAGNWDLIENTLGYTPENVANKENTTIDTNTTKYPTVNLLKTGLDTKQATLVSGTNIKTVNSTTLLGSGDLAVATTAQGALADSALQPGDIASGTITARADDINFSGGSDGDVLTVQADGSLALEAPGGGSGTVTSVAISGSDGLEVDSGSPITTSGTIALGVNKTALLAHINVEDGADVTDATNVNAAGAVMNSDYTPAHSILVQQSGTGSPTIVQIPNSTIVGRIAGGGSDIDALTASEVRTIINVEDGADVTDATNVAAAGAFMKSVDDTDDITDTATNRFTDDTAITRLANTSGTNTGDQTITNSSDATSHTVTLSASGGSVQLIEGSGITLTTGGTASAGTVTVAASGGSGATTALDNLSAVAINTSLVSDTDNTDDLGTTLKKWANLFVTTIGATATRVTKGWFTDIESTNIPTVGGTAILSSLTAPSFTTVELGAGGATDTTLSRVSAGDIAVEGNTIYRAGGTDVPVTDGGTGRSTSTTAYGLIAAGTTATGAHQTLTTGSSGQILRSGGASALPAYSTATYPDTAGTSGNVLQSDGTNFVSTTLSAASYTSVVNSAVSSSSYMTYQLMPSVGTTADAISNGWEESNVVMTANQGGGGIIFYDITAAAGSFIRSNMPGYGSQSFFRFADIASNAIVAKTRIKMLTGPGATEAISWGFNAHTFLEDSIEAGIRFCIADNGGDKLYAVTGDASNNKNTDVTGALTLTDWLNLAMVITSSQVLFYAGNTNALTLVATHSAASSGYIPTGTAQMKIGWGVAANNTPEFYFTPTIISLPTA